MGKIFSFRSNNYVEAEINGTAQRFYVLSPSALRRLKDSFGPLASAFTTLLAPNKTDVASSQRTLKKDDEQIETFEVEAAALEVLRMRDAQRAEAITSIIDTLTNEASQRELMRLIVASMRDVFSEEDRRSPSQNFLDEMLEDMSLDTLVECLIGISSANKKLVDPFLKKLPRAAQERVDEVAADLKNGLQAKESDTATTSS